LLLAAGAKRRRILCFNSKNWLILWSPSLGGTSQLGDSQTQTACIAWYCSMGDEKAGIC
jgi:hypothetical protein